MSHEAAREMIAEAWKQAWVASGLTFPVEIQNHAFKRPPNATWGRYTYLPGETEPAALGISIERTPFALILQIFLPENTGTKDATLAADALRPLNGAVRRSPDGKVVVNFRTVGLTPGTTEDGVEAFNVTIRGHHDIYP